MAKNPKWTREEEIIALDYYFQIYHEGGNVSDLIEEASNLLRIMPNSKNASDMLTYRNFNGVNMRMGNFMSLDPAYEGLGLTSVGKQTIAIWKEFEGDRERLAREAEQLRKTYILEGTRNAELNVDDDAALDLETKVEPLREGSSKQVLSTRYERNPKNREAAIKVHGAICQVCGFNFEEVYGSLGSGFIEVHHIKPLYSYGKETEINPIEDLVCLCSNCHRMIHRKKGSVVGVEELQKTVEQNKSRRAMVDIIEMQEDE